LGGGVTRWVDRTIQTGVSLAAEQQLHPITACCADLYGDRLAAF
jgi:hypothetical protein